MYTQNLKIQRNDVLDEAFNEEFKNMNADTLSTKLKKLYPVAKELKDAAKKKWERSYITN
jgi:hypothetical protein